MFERKKVFHSEERRAEVLRYLMHGEMFKEMSEDAWLC